MIVPHSVQRWHQPECPLDGWEGYILERSQDPDLFVAKSTPSGPNLLLIPGACEPWHTFEPLFSALSPSFTLWMTDLRGHGLSQRDESGRYQVVDYISDALAIVDNCIDGPLHIGGNSLGALVAAGVAAARPKRVGSLVLEDGPFFITEPNHWAHHPLRTEVFADMASRLKRREEEEMTSESFACLYRERPFAFMPAGDFEHRIRWASKMLPLLEDLKCEMTSKQIASMEKGIIKLISDESVNWGTLFPVQITDAAARKYEAVDWRVPAVIGGTEFSAGFGHLETLEAVKCRTLILEADRDLSGLLPDNGLALMERALGDRFRHVLIENSMHTVHETHPEAVAQEIEKMLL